MYGAVALLYTVVAYTEVMYVYHVNANLAPFFFYSLTGTGTMRSFVSFPPES